MLSENIFPMIGRGPRFQGNRDRKRKLPRCDDFKSRIADQLDHAGPRPMVRMRVIQKHDRREYFRKRVYLQQQPAVRFENPSNFAQDLAGVHDVVEHVNT